MEFSSSASVTIPVIYNFNSHEFYDGLTPEQICDVQKLIEKVKALADVYRSANQDKSCFQTHVETTMRKAQDLHSEIDAVLVKQENALLQHHFTMELQSESYKFKPIAMKSQPDYVMNQYYPHDIHRIKKDRTLQTALLPSIGTSSPYPKVLAKPYHVIVAHEIIGEIPRGMVVDHMHQDCCDWNFGHLRIISYRDNSNNRYDQVVIHPTDLQPEHMIRVQSYVGDKGLRLNLHSSGIFYDEISGNYYLSCDSFYRLMQPTNQGKNSTPYITYRQKALKLNGILHMDEFGVVEYLDGHIDDLDIDNFEDEA